MKGGPTMRADRPRTRRRTRSKEVADGPAPAVVRRPGRGRRRVRPADAVGPHPPPRPAAPCGDGPEESFYLAEGLPRRRGWHFRRPARRPHGLPRHPPGVSDHLRSGIRENSACFTAKRAEFSRIQLPRPSPALPAPTFAGPPILWYDNPVRWPWRERPAMLRVRTILYPTDFSSYSNQAYLHAVALAETHRASLTIAYVAGPDQKDDTDYWRGQLEQIRPANPNIPVTHVFLE